MSCNDYTPTQIPVSIGFDANGNAGSLVETKEIKVSKIQTSTDSERLVINSGGNGVLFEGDVTINGSLFAAGVTVQGASSISSLTDVNITSVTNREILVWDTATSRWINQTLSEANIVTVADLANYATNTFVSSNYASTNSLSAYATSSWVNSNFLLNSSIGATVQAYSTNLQAIRNTTGVAADRIIYYVNSTNAATATLTSWARNNLLNVNSAAAALTNIGGQPGNRNLDDISNLSPTTSEDGYVITWNDAAGQFQLQAQTGGGAASLNDLTDVNTTATPVANNHFLVYNSATGNWENESPANARISLGANTIGSNIFTSTNNGTSQSTFLQITSDNAVNLRTFAQVRDDLDVVPGVDVQAQNANLQSIANQSTASNTLIYFSGSSSAATTTLTQFGRSILDDANAVECRSTLSAQLSSVPLDNITSLCTGPGASGASAFGRLFYTTNIIAGSSIAQVPLFDTATIANNYGKVLKLTDAGVPTTGAFATPGWGSVTQNEVVGLATSNTPTFLGLNVGNTDTTITRSGAGDIAVENNIVYRQGGTDVSIGDGGTGASTAANARANLLPSSPANGDIMFYNGTDFAYLKKPTSAGTYKLRMVVSEGELTPTLSWAPDGA